MSKTTIPADKRVQVIDQALLEQHRLTLRAAENGPDVRVFGSKDEEGVGFPLRADDEWCISSDQSYGGRENDGLWMETETSNETDIQILKGTCIQRNVRRNQTAEITGDASGILKTSDQPLDVTGATVAVQEDLPLDVSGAVVSVQEATPLDVSAAVVATDPDTDDWGSLDGAALSANATVSVSLSAQGAEDIDGTVVSSGSYDVDVEWTDGAGTVLFTDSVASAVAGGTETDLNGVAAKSPHANVVITDTSGASQTATATAHLR